MCEGIYPIYKKIQIVHISGKNVRNNNLQKSEMNKESSQPEEKTHFLTKTQHTTIIPIRDSMGLFSGSFHSLIPIKPYEASKSQLTDC